MSRGIQNKSAFGCNKNSMGPGSLTFKGEGTAYVQTELCEFNELKSVWKTFNSFETVIRAESKLRTKLELTCS